MYIYKYIDRKILQVLVDGLARHRHQRPVHQPLHSEVITSHQRPIHQQSTAVISDPSISPCAHQSAAVISDPSISKVISTIKGSQHQSSGDPSISPCAHQLPSAIISHQRPIQQHGQKQSTATRGAPVSSHPSIGPCAHQSSSVIISHHHRRPVEHPSAASRPSAPVRACVRACACRVCARACTRTLSMRICGGAKCSPCLAA